MLVPLKLETVGYHMVKTRSLYVTLFLVVSAPGRDGQTDRLNSHS